MRRTGYQTAHSGLLLQRRRSGSSTQLRSGDPDAAETLSAVLPMVRGTGLQQGFQRVAKLIDDFDFEAAEVQLTTLMSAL